MKKLNLRMCESNTPPTDTSVLWVKRSLATNDILSVFKFIDGEWQPYLISVEFLKPIRVSNSKTN